MAGELQIYTDGFAGEKAKLIDSYSRQFVSIRGRLLWPFRIVEISAL